VRDCGVAVDTEHATLACGHGQRRHLVGARVRVRVRLRVRVRVGLG
jgi:hypothetical protein